MKILINNGTGYVDYTKYVAQESIQITDSINVPTLIQFTVCNLDAQFVVPKRNSYVRITCTNPNGIPSGVTTVLATGFVTNEPVRKYLGLSQAPGPAFGFQLYTYDIKITSDEWLLNVKSVPFIPAFVNQTQGQILAKLAQVLAPGFFDVCTHVASGDVVPYFQYDPEQNWSDIVKEFADASRYRYKVIDRVVWYQPFGDAPLGITYNDMDHERTFDPTGLKADVLSVPPVNDAIVVGQVEPQTYEEDNFVGDGFTGNFALKHPMFEGASDLLLQEDWSGTVFASDLWNVQDPGDNFSLAGALNVNGGLGLGTSYILGNNGVELGGGLNMQHGEFLFTDYCDGIVGGVYAPSSNKDPLCPTFDAPDLSMANCVAGFDISNTSMYAIPYSLTSGHFSVPAGRKLQVAFGMPTVVQYGPADPGATNGHANLDGSVGPPNLSQGDTGMTGSCGLCNWQWAIKMSAFQMPTLPADAVILGIFAGAEMLMYGNSVFDNSFSAAGSSTDTSPWGVSAGGFFLDNGISTAGSVTTYRQGGLASGSTWYTTQNLGAASGVVTNGTMYMRFFQTLSMGGGTTSVRWYNPRFVIYYTTGTTTRPSVAGTIVVPSASGASGIAIQPIYNGVSQGPIVTTKLNHHYFLQTFFNGRRYDRYNRVYRTLAGTPFGGQYNSSLAEITWVVSDIDLTREGAPTTSVYYRVSGATVPAFGLYAPINANFLNLILQTTLLAFPPQGTLEVRSLYGPTGGSLPTLPQNLGPYQHYLLGFGFNNPVATIGVNNDINYLQFYNDAIFYSSGDVTLGTTTIPSVGARIKLRSWEAAQSVGRVRDTADVATTAVIVGDDGVRLAILSNMTPLPRTSAECEQAAAAAITDRELVQFQGTYSASSWFWDRTQDYPRTGRYFACNSPQRGVFSRQLVATTVRITVDDMKGEWLSYDIDFSPDNYLEKLLVKFMQRSDNILTPKDAGKKLNFLYLNQLNTSWLPDLQNCSMVEYNGSQFTFDLGLIPGSSGYLVEVRRADANWGQSSKFLITRLTNQVNTFQRSAFDESIYLRLVSASVTGASVTGAAASGVLVSRFSKKLRIQAPLVPNTPTAQNIDLTIGTRPVFTFGLAQNQDIRNVYGLEVRDTAGNVLAQQVFGSFQDLAFTLQNDAKLRAYTVEGYFFNLFWDYSPVCQMSYNVTAPSISGLVIDESTHVLSWSVLTGQPTGHRIEVERHPTNPNTPIGISANTMYLATPAHVQVSLGDGTGICKATSGTPTLFSMDLNSLMFNTHPKTLLPGFTETNADTDRPMNNQSISNGAFASNIPLAGNSYQAGVSPLTSFNMLTTGTFYVSTSGDYFINGSADDGLLLGIGNGAVAGGSNPQINGPYSTTPLHGYPIMFGINQPNHTDYGGMKVTFPAPGYYPFEVCYSQGPGGSMYWTMLFANTWTQNGGNPFYSGSMFASQTFGSKLLVTLPTVGFTGVSGTNVYTINHPNNPTDIVSTQISSADWAVPIKITVIPFDQFGDGVPAFIYHNLAGGNTDYIMTPSSVLTQPVPGAYEIDMAAFDVSLGTGKVLLYAPRVFPVSDPGSVPQTYYVTIYDPNQVGDGSSTTATLTAFCDTNATRAQTPGYWFAGKIIVTHAGGTTGSPGGPNGLTVILVVAG